MQADRTTAERTRRLMLATFLSVSMSAACSATDGNEATSSSEAAPVTSAPVLTTVATSTTTTTLPPTTTSVATTTSEATTTTAQATTTTAPAEIPDRSLAVPSAPPPTIDGIIDAAEWEQAIAVTMSNGDTAYWQHHEGTLYVALDGTELGAVNLVIAMADELWILHSSAALGSSLYVPGESAWQQSHGYTWCCRSANDDTARLGLLEDEGWQANIGFTGDVGVVEYEVSLPWGFSSAALVYHTEDRDSAYWPTDLEPEAADLIVNNGWTDPTLDPKEWWMIVPVDPAD